MLAIYSGLTREMADLYGLVLESQRIPFSFSKKADGWVLSVPPNKASKATEEILAYCKENAVWALPLSAPPPVINKWTGISGALFLLIFFLATGPFSHTQGLLRSKGAMASAILQGEIWRTVTALTLHADVVHLAGNMAGLGIFALWVCSLAGFGAGWFLILMSGILGNGLTALFYRTAHLSAGASTAVFGALGILVGMRLAANIRGTQPLHKRKYRQLWTMAAGGALLAFLGAGPRSDVMAHLFGMVSGAGLGVFYSTFIKKPLPRSWQWLFTAASLCVVIFAWSWASL